MSQAHSKTPAGPVASPSFASPGAKTLVRRPGKVGPYVVLYRLGHGGMSEVHLGEHQSTGQRVAIKHVPAGGDPSHRRRLRREARTTSRLHHPSIVNALDVIDGDDGLWLIMDYVDGTTLYEVTQGGPMAPRRALKIALQITEALIAAHDQGFLHRDLKSENVMLEAGDRVRLLDFGLAKALWIEEESQTLTVHGEVMGTCRAMSPEQARGLELDGRSDLFALGSLLYEMMTGTSPFQASTPVATMTRVCNHQPLPSHLVESQVPRQASSLISRLMAKKPADRPQDAREAADAIRTVIHSFEKRPRWPWPVAAVAFVILLSLVALAMRLNPPAPASGEAQAAPERLTATAFETARQKIKDAKQELALENFAAARILAHEVLTTMLPPEDPLEKKAPVTRQSPNARAALLATKACQILATVDQEYGVPEASQRWLRVGLYLIESHDLDESTLTVKAQLEQIDQLMSSPSSGADP